MPTENAKYVSVGVETAPGTAVAGTRTYQDTADDWVVEAEPIMIDTSLYAGQQADLSHNFQQSLKRVTGSIDTGFYNKGMSPLINHLLGFSTPVAQVNSTSNARQGRTHRTTGDGDNSSLTVRRGRGRRLADWSDGVIEEFIYAGCVASGFTLGLANKRSPWKLTVPFVGMTETPGGAAVATLYAPVGALATNDAIALFSGKNTSITVGGTAAPAINDFTLTGAFQLAEPDPLNTEENIEKPFRQGKPEFTGSFTATYTDETRVFHERYRDGGLVSIVAECKQDPGATAQTQDHSRDILRITLAECRITNSVVSGPPDNPTNINCEYKVFWGGGASDYAVELYIQNSETSDL